jgi:HNH endonuclease/helix-turn-helix resolvase-like protein
MLMFTSLVKGGPHAPYAMVPNMKPFTRRDFWKLVRKMPSGCWEWQGLCNESGYGIVYAIRLTGVRKCRAHRAAWILKHGQIPKGKHVLHKCDNPPCVRPSHLFLGTHVDNMRDASRKGRLVSVPGELRANSKLDRKKARNIRELYSAGTYSQRELAAKFQVSRATIVRVLVGTHWKER